MKRGYSICTKASDGSVVKNANVLKKEELIKVQFHKGKISGIVEEIEQ